MLKLIIIETFILIHLSIIRRGCSPGDGAGCPLISELVGCSSDTFVYMPTCLFTQNAECVEWMREIYSFYVEHSKLNWTCLLCLLQEKNERATVCQRPSQSRERFASSLIGLLERRLAQNKVNGWVFKPAAMLAALSSGLMNPAV